MTPKNREKSRPSLAGGGGGRDKAPDYSPCGGDTQLRTVKETAELLRVSERAVARLVARNELPSVRLGRRRLIVEDDLRNFIESRRERGGGS